MYILGLNAIRKFNETKFVYYAKLQMLLHTTFVFTNTSTE